MEMTWFHVLDVLLLLGMALRVTRMVTADDIPGQWYIKDPLDRWMHGPGWDSYLRLREQWQALVQDGHDPDDLEEPLPPPPLPGRARWHRYLEGLGCPFCVGFWICVAATASLLLVGGPGDAAEPWRWVAAALTLNYVAAHISAALD